MIGIFVCVFTVDVVKDTLLTMSDKIQKCIHFILLLGSKDTPRIQKQYLIKSISKIQLSAICELALNILRGHIPINTDQGAKLKRYRKRLRRLSNKRCTIVEKKRLFNLQLSDILLEPCVNFIKENAQSFETL